MLRIPAGKSSALENTISGVFTGEALGSNSLASKSINEYNKNFMNHY